MQVALVELLRTWGIRPSYTLGHSSGEIAAAYASGKLSFNSAMAAAFYRGSLCAKLSQNSTSNHGGMLAVGMSEGEVEPYIQGLKSGKVIVACINSPESVTISGDATAIDELSDCLDDIGCFNRKLKINVAYHSEHMRGVADDYARALKDSVKTSSGINAKFYSSVYPYDAVETGSDYWVQNLLSPVRFNEAVKHLCLSSHGESKPDILIEIGPHAALAGPIKQICKVVDAEKRPSYLPSLARNKNAVEEMQELACSLFGSGVEVNFANINFPTGSSGVSVLTDLPTYPWDHSTIFWHEGRLAHNYLHREFPQHDLLGTLTDDSSELDLKWTNHIRLEELPWLRDHVVRADVVFPGAGYLSMAVEGARQKAVMAGKVIESFCLRDTSFLKALVIPDTSEGVEVSLILEPLDSTKSESKSWDTFRILSYGADRKAILHCQGIISISQDYDFTISETDASHLDQAESVEENDSYKKWLSALGAAEIILGPSFQLLSGCVMTSNRTTCDLNFANTASLMPQHHEEFSTVKAPFLDAFLQLSVFAQQDLRPLDGAPLLPSSVEELVISKDIAGEPGTQIRALGETRELSKRDFGGRAVVTRRTSIGYTPIAQLTGATFTSMVSSGPEDPGAEKTEKLCWNTVWRPDIDDLDQNSAEELWGIPEMTAEERSKLGLVERSAWICIRRAFEAGIEGDVSQMAEHHRHLFRWMRAKLDAGCSGTLPLQSDDWLSTISEDDVQKILDEASSYSAYGQMTVRIGLKLPEILRKEIDPLSVMLEDNLLDRFYSESAGQDRVYQKVGQFLDLAAHKNSQMSILEIGGGTGSATSWALKALGTPGETQPRFSSYRFSDISTGFFEKARDKFSAWEGLIDFKSLNIEQDLEHQGFHEEFDVILAANVLHATERMAVTMQNVHKVLKPGGKLVLVEVTNTAQMAGALAFGLLPGWWMGKCTVVVLTYAF